MEGPTETSIGIQSEIKPINPKSYWTIKSSGDSLSQVFILNQIAF